MSFFKSFESDKFLHLQGLAHVPERLEKVHFA